MDEDIQVGPSALDREKAKRLLSRAVLLMEDRLDVVAATIRCDDASKGLVQELKELQVSSIGSESLRSVGRAGVSRIARVLAEIERPIDEANEDVSVLLTRILEATGLSQRQLASALSKTSSTVSRWESGEMIPRYEALLSLQVIGRLAGVEGSLVGVHELLGYEPAAFSIAISEESAAVDIQVKRDSLDRLKSLLTGRAGRLAD